MLHSHSAPPINHYRMKDADAANGVIQNNICAWTVKNRRKTAPILTRYAGRRIRFITVKSVMTHTLHHGIKTSQFSFLTNKRIQFMYGKSIDYDDEVVFSMDASGAEWETEIEENI